MIPQDFRTYLLNVFLRRKKLGVTEGYLPGRSTLVLSNGIRFSTITETHAAIGCVGANIFSITHIEFTEIFFL